MLLLSERSTLSLLHLRFSHETAKDTKGMLAAKLVNCQKKAFGMLLGSSLKQESWARQSCI